MKTLVLGLGNTILSDDGAGIQIAELIRRKCPDTEVLDASAAGFRVVDEIIGYDRLILIDSIKSGQACPGTLYRYQEKDFNKTLHHTSPHDMDFFSALEIMRQRQEKIPSDIIIYAVEIEDNLTFSERCTSLVAAAIPQIADTIINEQQLC